MLTEFPSETPQAQAKLCEQYAIELSLQNLTSFPWIRERVEAGQLTLHGWYFDMDSGQLLGFSPETASFKPLGVAEPSRE